MSELPQDPSHPLDDAVESAAAAWLVKHDRGLDAGEQDAFLQWLAERPAHRESFERHRRMWTDFNALAQWRPEHSAEPNPDLLARPRRSGWWRWTAPVALAAAAAVAVMVWRTPEARSSITTLTLEAAAYRQETLPDGSLIDLNAGAHAVVQFSPAERRVLLMEGEAQFTVVKNPARPFIVRAAGVDVCAVGTAFNVKLAGASLEVLVTEGTVHLSPSSSRASTRKADPVSSAPPLLA